MTQSTLWLSQLQFFSGIGFVLLFLAIEMGLAWLLVYFRWRALSGDAAWLGAYRFWVRVFALAFILSFSACIPVLLQFGSLWPAIMDKAGEVVGPLFAAGILTAFIFKSCCLGAMLFGQRRLSGPVHWLMVKLVAVGVTLSAWWFVALLGWTRTPSGAQYADGVYRVTDWFQVVFNPSMPWYAGLLAAGALLSAVLLVVGVVSAQTLRRPVDEAQRVAFRTAVRVAALAAPAQVALVAGLLLMVSRHQPAFAAALAAYWESGAPNPLVLFAWPDTSTALNLYSVSLETVSSYWLTRDDTGRLVGLNQFAGMMPPVALVFWSFRLAFFFGLVMLVVVWLTWLRGRSMANDPAALSRRWRVMLLLCSWLAPAMLLCGFACIFFGGYPFAIAGTVTLTEVISPLLTFNTVAATTVAYWILYLFFIAGFIHMLRHIARYGVVPVARRRGRA